MRRWQRVDAGTSCYLRIPNSQYRNVSAIRILIAEDQTLMRQGLKTILDLEDGFEVVGEAADGQEAVDRALALRPDVVLMDVQMPHMNGVEARPSSRRAAHRASDHSDHI